MQSVIILVNCYSIAQSADGIPLETYPAAAAQTAASTSCEAAVVFKPKARLCEPWVSSE
jgi:hypothetical protein